MRSIVCILLSAITSIVVARADGLDSWTNRVSDSQYFTIAAGETLLLAMDFDGWPAAASRDGTNWTQTNGLPLTVRGIGHGSGVFVAVGNYAPAGAPAICRSPNGVDWQFASINYLIDLPGWTGLFFHRVAYGASTFVATGFNNHPAEVMLYYGGPQGATWWPCSINGETRTPGLVQGLTYGSGLFVTVGSGGTILTSGDGTNWAPQVSGTTSNLTEVAFGGGRYVAIGEVTLSSTDGKQWRQIDQVGRGPLRRLIYGASRFVGVGDGGLIQSSTDGTQWVTHNSGTQSNLYDVIFYKGAFCAAGQSGILQSGKVPSIQLRPRLIASGSELELVVTSDPGLSVRIQSSTDLTDWKDWKAVNNETGSTNLVDVTTATRSWYRAVSP